MLAGDARSGDGWWHEDEIFILKESQVVGESS